MSRWPHLMQKKPQNKTTNQWLFAIVTKALVLIMQVRQLNRALQVFHGEQLF